MAVKEAAFDCAIYSTADSKEPLVCFSFGDVKDPEDFAFVPCTRWREKHGGKGEFEEDYVGR